MTTVTPEVTWAQRSSDNEPEKNYVFLTIVAADVPESDLKLDLQPTKLSFKGASTSKKVTYAVELEFFAEIDPAESKIQHSGRDVTLVLRKKELKQEFWPRLLKDNKKMHFLKTNFDKWVDEDEQDEAPADDEMMNQMNPMGGGGGGGGDGGFGGIDFSKLGGAGGPGGMDMASMMGGMGGAGGPGGMDMASMMQSMGAGGMGGMPEGMDDDSDDDDDMPELENDETKPAAAAASGDKPKIEEVA